jgi:2-polyprenyl-3-methyl-5-hydroxy-6-metoxy-1,4-benzoquinol methylase
MEVKLTSGIIANFTALRLTDNEDCLIGLSTDNRFFVKMEVASSIFSDRKTHNLQAEAEIIRHLNERNCRTCVKLRLLGKIKGEELLANFADKMGNKFDVNADDDYTIMVTDAAEPMAPDFYSPDIAMAIIEQKKLGVWNGDIALADVLMDTKTNCVKLVDYDQAVMLDDDKINMPNQEFIKWINEHAVERWGHWGMTDFLYNTQLDWDTHFAHLFEGDCFNLASTYLFKSQETTLNEAKIYHSFRTPDVYAVGERTLDDRKQFLDRIEFQDNERVLDMGCNAGLLCHYLHDRGCDVWGIDIDAAVIEGAQILANIVGKPEINFQCHDVDNGGPIGYFDTIMLFSVIHHTANILANAERIAKLCNRIIIECRLIENGAKPVDGNWIQTTVWRHPDLDSLTAGLEELFPGFEFVRVLGQGDRDRYVMEFMKTAG